MIVYIDRSSVHEGCLDELKDAMEDLVDFVQANEPGILSYSVYFDPNEDQMTVVHTHAHQDSLEAHFEIAGSKFAPIGAFIELESIEVYGHLGQALLERLRSKASTLGEATVRVHPLHHGFDRAPHQEGQH